MADGPIGRHAVLQEARMLLHLLETGTTAEEIHTLITVPPALERRLREFARANPEDAHLVDRTLIFRRAVLAEFEKLIGAAAPESHENPTGGGCMFLTTEQSYALLEKHGCYVTEVCDKCSRLLGPVRYTRKGEDGVWCSRECRGDAQQVIRKGGRPRKYRTPEECHAAQSAGRKRLILLSDRELEPYFVYEWAEKEFVIDPTAVSLEDLANTTHALYFDPKPKNPHT